VGDSAGVACDVLVAGSGAGGLAAAITAAHHGLDVIVTEKEPLFGGTTAYSAGGIWIPASSHAKRAGVNDSAYAALRYLEHEVGDQLH
jgi:succinate dehydrogenase/fumarate reductase flavoprotein subunit